MLALPTVAIGLSFLARNAIALPSMPAMLEERDQSMTDTINMYISALESSGFTPNAKVSTRDSDNETQPLDVSSLLEARNNPLPPLPQVLNVLATFGFKPSKRDLGDNESAAPGGGEEALAERASAPLPDTNLVISLLKEKGFMPTGHTKARDLGSGGDLVSRFALLPRQAASNADVQTVVSNLVKAGYNPSDFGSSKSVMAFQQSTMKLETTANCPTDNNTLYATGGQTYQIGCYVDYPQGDLPADHSVDFPACLAKCSAYPGGKCIAAVWQKGAQWSPTNQYGNCYMKYTATKAAYNVAFNSGRNTNFLF